MSKFGSFVKYWLPVLVWMAVIFTASADSESFRHSSRLIAPVLRWLFPHISEHAVDGVVFIARKCAHVAEYGVFALLVWRGLRQPRKNDRRSWNWRQARLTLLAVFLYAASDEFHQIFVATRTPRIHDVVIDTLGGAAALLALWFFRFRRPRAETSVPP